MLKLSLRKIFVILSLLAYHIHTVMARNEEKQFCRLNRMILQQQKEDELKKNPKRPSLHTLSTAAEIKHWLPSIKKDIDFYLKQSKVWCYPERKIAEFNSEIDRLRREHQAYVWRLRQLEPTLSVLPGTDRPYSNKTNPCTKATSVEEDNKEDATPSLDAHPPRKKFKRIPLPILHSPIEQQYVEAAKSKAYELHNLTEIPHAICEGVTHRSSDRGDIPCDSLTDDTPDCDIELQSPHWPSVPPLHLQDAPLDFGSRTTFNKGKAQDHQQTVEPESNRSIQSVAETPKDSLHNNILSKVKCNVLGLDYEGSSSEDEEEKEDNT